MNPKVYLAGPISHTTWKGATDWRMAVREELAKYGIEGIDPMRGKADLRELLGRKHFDTVYGQAAQAYENYDNPMASAKAILNRDRWDVYNADVILVNFLGAKKVSIGTVMEIAWANALGKLVIVAMEDDNVHAHGMLIHCMGIICDTLEEAVAATKIALSKHYAEMQDMSEDDN